MSSRTLFVAGPSFSSFLTPSFSSFFSSLTAPSFSSFLSPSLSPPTDADTDADDDDDDEEEEEEEEEGSSADDGRLRWSARAGIPMGPPIPCTPGREGGFPCTVGGSRPG